MPANNVNPPTPEEAKMRRGRAGMSNDYLGIGVSRAQFDAARELMGDNKIGWFEPASHGLVAFRCWGDYDRRYVTTLLGRDGSIVQEWSERSHTFAVVRGGEQE